MLADESFSMLISEVRSLPGNQPFWLDDPTALWQVQSGRLALFASQRQQGRRRYLFTVKPGEFLLPGPAEPAANGDAASQLLAVPLEATQLRRMPDANLGQWLQGEPEAAIAALELWIYRLGAAAAGRVAPTGPTPLQRHGVLTAGEVLQPMQGVVTWVQLYHGTATLLGLERLSLAPAMGRLPLSSSLWMQACDRVELHLAQATELLPDPALVAGFHQMQRLLLQAMHHLEQQDLQQEYHRFAAREQLNAQAVSTTLQQLAAVLQPGPAPARDRTEAPTAEDTLLQAVGAVGRALGLSIQPPAPSEDQRRRRDPLAAIARASRIRLRAVTLRDNWWQQDVGPLLAYTRDDHRPVALLPVNSTQFDVIDPGQQRRVRCDRAIADTLDATAYTLYRPLPDTVTPRALLQFALRGHAQELLLVLLTGVAATGLGMVTPQATGILMDHAIPSANQTLLWQIAAGLLATTFGVTLFQLTQGIALMRLETFADAATQAAVWDRLLKLKTSFFRQYSIGDLSSRVSAVSQIRQKLGNTILKSIFSSVFSFLNLGLLFYYSPPLAWIAALVALINIAVTVGAGVLTLRQVRPLLDQQGRLFGMMVQIINGVSKFRVAGAEARAFAYWGRQYSEQLQRTLGTQGIEDDLAVVNSLLSAMTPAVLFACATSLLQQAQADGGSFSTGTFLAFNAAFGTFIAGATSLSTTVIDVLEVLPIWQRALPILQAAPEVDDSKADPGRLVGQVTVDHVVFRYRPEGAWTLDTVTLRAEPGEFIALVGPSGSGKSTLFRLLLGFDTPESGTIAYDGQDLAGLDANAVRRQLGVVLQTSRLMAGTIFENISSSALISMEEAWEAARMAGLADDVAAMPMGMHTVVSEGGSNLSGGQRQRLLIARSLALRPRILLFDEATSALDNRTQAIVSDSLERLKVTRIVVAHRLSTIRNADRIYVLQQGRVVQEGGFEQLATMEGLFRQLIQRQQV